MALKKGRPVIYSGATLVYLSTAGKTSIHKGSDRRAIVDAIVDHGGKMTLSEIDEHFGFDIRSKVFALQRAGWVRIEA